MPRKIKVISVSPVNDIPSLSVSQADDATIVKLADEVERTIPPPETQLEDPSSDASSGELEALVEQAYKEQRKKRLVKDQQECQYCNKKMTSKALKYSHDKVCKSHPDNQPKPIEIAPPPPPEPIEPKPKRKPPVRKPKETAPPTQSIPPIEPIPPMEPIPPTQPRQSLEDFIEQNKTQRQQLRQMRIDTLRSQAF